MTDGVYICIGITDWLCGIVETNYIVNQLQSNKKKTELQLMETVYFGW